MRYTTMLSGILHSLFHLDNCPLDFFQFFKTVGQTKLTRTFFHKDTFRVDTELSRQVDDFWGLFL